MDVLELIRGFIYVLSAGLFYPVLLGLLLLAAWMAVAAGGLLREALDRRNGAATRHALDVQALEHAAAAAADAAARQRAVDAALGSAEQRSTRSLDRVRFAIRVGPSLGLMGTLIPMATALASLAGGDLAGLAENMVTAFATTVVGLAVGVTAYLLTLVRQRWAEADLGALELFADQLVGTVPSSAPVQS